MGMRGQHKNKRAIGITMAQKACDVCGAVFEYPKRENRVQKCCSVECRGKLKTIEAAKDYATPECLLAVEEYRNAEVSMEKAGRIAGFTDKKMRAALRHHGVPSKSKGRPGVPRGRPRAATIICGCCGVSFEAFRSANRHFCSYQCHLDNGGAQKAGAAAAMAKSKYGFKKDANHDELFTFMRAYIPVKDLSSVGGGLPDGLAWINKGWHLFDVKNPETSYGRKGLNKLQKVWAQTWKGGPVYLIYDEKDAKNFVKGRFNELKKFPEDKMTPEEFHEVTS